MIRFNNGPAAGQTLYLKRAPLFLRAVQSKNGDWDALDQLDDEPKAGETVHVYRQVSNQGMVHIRASGKGAKAISGFWPMASYELFDVQPDEETGRDNVKWAAWCYEQAEKIKATKEESKNGSQT